MEHPLLGLVSLEDCTAAGVLREADMSKEIIAGRIRPKDIVHVDLDPARYPVFIPTAPPAEPAGMEGA